MSDKVFVDTNILLYARDLSEPDKQSIASDLLAELWTERTGRTSVQVLNEYYVNVTQKLKPGLSREAAWEDVNDLMTWQPVDTTPQLMKRAFSTQSKYGLSWWDSLIVAAAHSAGCVRLLSVDLSTGRKYHGIEAVNPFAAV